MLRAVARLLMLMHLAAPLLAAAYVAARPGPLAWLGLALAVVLAVPAAAVLALRWVKPPTTAFMRRHAGKLRRQGLDARIEREWVAEADLPPDLRLAAIAGEDVYFALHDGFDWESLRIAYAHNRSAGPDGLPRGGSTISQQVAKNLFLTPAHSYLRKAAEAYLTLLIEAAWPKRRILEVYLNIAQFGPATFGAQAAARRFFGKPARELTRQEAALMIAVLPKPREYRVDQPTPAIRLRQVMILNGMKRLGGNYLARLDRPGGRLRA